MRQRRTVTDNTRPLPRVPVPLSLPAFDPGNDVGVAARVVSDRLDRWLTRHLVTAFGLPAKVAAMLGDVRPVVITCRTNRYHQLSGHVAPIEKVPPAEQETTSNAGRREVVQDATAVSTTAALSL